MRSLPIALALLTAACTRSSGPGDVNQSLRSFMQTVAADVTREGPSAWQKHFLDDPAFFMAADGKLQFSDGRSAQQAIPNIARIIHHIQLEWGPDLRFDIVTPAHAVAACSYHEVLDTDSGRIDAHGFFTGLAEWRPALGRWQFRNAHWSTEPPKADAR